MNYMSIPLVIAVAMIAACVTNQSSHPRKKIGNEVVLASIFGKRLTIDAGYAYINKDGTISGEYGGTKTVGTWEFVDGYFCRALTEGPERAMENSKDCLLLEIAGKYLHATWKKGKGDSFKYIIDE